MDRIDKKLNKFVKELNKSGVLDWADKLKKKFPKSEVYLVGGAVRDAVFGIENKKDYDFVVRKVSMRDLEKFLSRLGWVELLGKNFGVLKFKPKKNTKTLEPFDIALPRSEFSIARGRYKGFKVKFNKDLNIEQDLFRRDFTMNAIAIFLSKEIQIIDPFNGLDDIKKKIIRCTGASDKRLSEDYTRILRAVRFACQLNFKIAPEIKKAVQKIAAHLNDEDKNGNFVSPREVIAKELLKAFAENHLRAVELYDKLGLFKVLMPEALKMKKCPQPKKYHSEGDVWKHTILALKNINSKRFINFEKRLNDLLPDSISLPTASEKLELIFAVLFHDIGKPYTIQKPKKKGLDRIRFNDHDNVGAELAKGICERLKLSAPEKLGIDCSRLAWLVRKHMLLIHGHPSKFRSHTLEKYFFNNKYPGKNLIKLAWLDISATITDKGPLKFDLLKALLKRIKDMKELVKQKKAEQNLPGPLLNGNEIMRICRLKPGKKIGEIKDILREKQLNGEIKNKREAKKFIKSLKVRG